MLRPVLFKIISTTQLKVTFNDYLSASIGIDNFKIESVSEIDSFLEILSIQVDEKSVLINTRPQKSKAYYLLKLQDAPSSNFETKNGVQLVNDDLSRDIYFVGIEKVNQIRDDIFYKTPGIYNLDGSLVQSILSTQADNILAAQHAIGSVLNDNYISQTIVDEYRVRGSGSVDRLANENAYYIDRVSLLPTGTSTLRRTIEIDSTDIYPINLRQEFVELFEIQDGTLNSSFNGFLLSLPEKNIIKVSYAKLIRQEDSYDCDGNIGTEYNLNKYKYTVRDNRFDQKNAFQSLILESNQVLFSDFGNWNRPKAGDKIILSYYYDNASISILNNTVEVYEITSVINESIPSNSKSFSLQNGRIIDSLDEQPITGGVTFKESENSDITPVHFQEELGYNISSLPSKIGQYTINYETGDVFLVGSKIGEGTGYNYFFADYIYKKVYKNNLDYSIYNNEFNLNYLRPVFGKNIKISFDYDSVFAEKTDYNSMAHKEVLSEDVENRITSSFSLKTKNGPITNVFRILNQSTGELYSLNYFYDNDIYFTGNKLPSAAEINGEFSNFKKVSGKELFASGYLITPVNYGVITSNLTNLNIEINPGIPSELIDQLSTDYIVRFLDQNIDDYKITGFYSPDSNGLIKGFSIASGLTLPSIGSQIQIGTKAFIFNLDDSKIMNLSADGIGSAVNSSLELDLSIFKSEKYFEPISKNYELTLSSSGSQSYIISEDQSGTLNKNLSRLRKNGDYTVDYQNGVIYLSVNYNDNNNAGLASYITSSHLSRNENIISVSRISKKNELYPDDIINYSSFNFSKSEITINDIERSTSIYDGSDFIDTSGQISELLLVNENYEVLTEKTISSIKFIGLLKDLFGENIDSSLSSERYEESNAAELLSRVDLGGKNLYLSEYVSYNYNLIDLKASSSSRFKLSGSFYEIKFRTKDISSIFEITNQGGTKLLDQSLNYNIISDVETISIIDYSTSEYKINFNSIDSKYYFNSGFDFISNGIDRWKVNGFSTSGYFIINKISEVYEEYFSEDIFNVVIRPNIFIGNETTIQYPVNNYILTESLAKLSYITIYTPQPGTALAIDYSSGAIFFDYVYLTDKIVVYYEYGDNEIDWSINNSISEGQGYYVSYRYGALRSALRKNFGALTSIPFFNSENLSFDRELYRDSIAGTLSAFPKGPTIPAISGLVNSIVKTDPTINELTFGSWILGRDYLNPAEVSYKGSLEFKDGKFGSGLQINNDNSLWLPSISNISLNEGTVEFWITPDWYGINNDADLAFSFDNIGSKKHFYIGGDPFSTKGGYDVVGSWDQNDVRRGFDFSSGKLRIYKTSDNTDGYISEDYSNLFGIYKKNLNLNRETINSESVELSVNYSYLVKSSDSFIKLVESGSYKAAAIVSDNAYKTFDLNIIASTFKDSGLTKVFNIENTEYESLSNFEFPYPTATCKCSFPSQLDVFEKFDKLEIKITFNNTLTKEEIFSEEFWTEEDLKSLMVVDNYGKFYQVVALGDIFGKRYENNIPDTISEIYLLRYPLNYPEITSKDYLTLNNVLFSQFIILKKQIKLELKEENKSKDYFSSRYVWNFDWNKKIKINYYIDPVNNLSWIGNSAFKTNFFFTDLNDSNLIGIIGDDVSISSTGIGVFGNSSIYVSKHLINVNYKYNLNDIYIGSTGIHPNSNIFTLNRLSDDINCIGISNNVDISDGVYIGYDSNCLSPLNSNVGQWILKARFIKYNNLPYDVEIDENGYSNLIEYVFIDNPIIGSIKSSGTFSSIAKGRRTISGDCLDVIGCSKHFRFFGNKLLDSDGWSLIQDSDSEVINDVYGGREAESFTWRKIGDFDTENSAGIYRILNISGFSEPEEYLKFSGGLSTTFSCTEGNIELIVSAKINSIDEDVFSISKDIGVLSSGITILEINSGDYDIGVCLTKDIYDNNMISMINLSTMEILETSNYNWNDDSYHKYQLYLDRDNSIISLYLDDIIFIQKDLFSISTIDKSACDFNTNPSFSIFLIDQRTINSESYFDTISSPVLDINLIESNLSYNPGSIKLEDSDLFIVSGNLVNFELHPNPSSEDEINIDGYITESDIDEIMITSDNERYLVDTGISEDNSRFSVFKDGKGFLNFRIIDSGTKDNTIYNIATNIKNFSPGERHHIAASWRLNTSFEKDEMHLFVDGLEVPSLFRFGGFAPIKFNSKFSDVSRENLWNYMEKKIVFSEIITDGVISTGSNIISSSSMIIDDSLIGRTILFGDDTGLYGKAVIILEVGEDWVAVGDSFTTEPYLFQSSESNLNFYLAPYTTQVLTDIKNEKFSIGRINCEMSEEELGGIGYEIVNGSIIIDNRAENFGYRYNKTLKVIEFVKRNEFCNYIESILKTDIDIHIKTYGLTGRNFKEVLSISGTSLFLDEGLDPIGVENSRDGYSILMTTGPRPKDLLDVSIKKYILREYSIPSDTVEELGGSSISNFEIDLSDAKMSLETINISKNNDGRYLEIKIDSDNINLSQSNILTIFGWTTAGYISEDIIVNKNGSFFSLEKYTSLEKITGSFEIIDSGYDFVALIDILEKNSIFIQDGSGDYANIYRFSNGAFILSIAEESSYVPFELPTGYYLVEYSSNLRINIPAVGQRLYIGNDITENKPLLGTIDEFQILNTMLSDIRPWEVSQSGIRTVTEDYYRENPACITDSSLVLIDFENPIEKQSRRLRNKKFLDSLNNFTYTLPLNERERLLSYINNEEEFINYMMFLGYSKDTAEDVFFECSKAEMGPIYNLAGYLPQQGNYFASPNSVNSSFGQAAKFDNSAALMLNNNNNILRNSAGTIEFWYQPRLDTFNDGDTRTLFESSSVQVARFKSTSPYLIKLSSPASSIVSIRLLSSSKLGDSSYYSEEEKTSILFDEVSTVESTGRYSKGTGTLKDFSIGSKLSSDGMEVYLTDSLPGSKIDVLVTYIPKQYSGEKISIYKDKFSRIISRFETKDFSYIIPVDVSWTSESWHRICLSYSLSGRNNFIKMFVDGSISNTIYRYNKDENPDVFNPANIISDLNISLSEEFSQIVVGNRLDKRSSATGTIDNLRISRGVRSYPKTPDGEEYDLNYSSNYENISPVAKDDLTTYLNDFNYESSERNIFLANIIDPKYGIFDFEVLIRDDFNRVVGISDGKVEDLIVDLINRLKSAHCNAYVKFIDKKCKE